METGQDPLGRAGSSAAGSGNTGGHFFASLAELDDVIAEWESLCDAIRQDGHRLLRAQQNVGPPARDEMSALVADATLRSLAAAERHNRAMAHYAEAYLAELRATREAYAVMDHNGAVDQRGVGDG